MVFPFPYLRPKITYSPSQNFPVIMKLFYQNMKLSWSEREISLTVGSGAATGAGPTTGVGWAVAAEARRPFADAPHPVQAAQEGRPPR